MVDQHLEKEFDGLWDLVLELVLNGSAAQQSETVFDSLVRRVQLYPGTHARKVHIEPTLGNRREADNRTISSRFSMAV